MKQQQMQQLRVSTLPQGQLQFSNKCKYSHNVQGQGQGQGGAMQQQMQQEMQQRQMRQSSCSLLCRAMARGSVVAACRAPAWTSRVVTPCKWGGLNAAPSMSAVAVQQAEHTKRR